MPHSTTAAVAAVAGALRAEMARLRIRDQTLASLLGRSHMWVARRRRGCVPLSVEDAHAIAEVLQIPPDTLLSPGRTPTLEPAPEPEPAPIPEHANH